MKKICNIVLTEYNIPTIKRIVTANLLEVGKEYIEIVTGNHTTEETTHAVDSALEYIGEWYKIIELSWMYSSATAQERLSNNKEKDIVSCRKNILYMYTIYEALKNNNKFYDKQFSISFKEAVAEGLTADDFRDTSSDKDYKSCNYCIEADVYKILLDELDYRANPGDWRCFERFVHKNISGPPKPSLCILVQYSDPQSLNKIQEKFPDCIVHCGADAFQFYKEYIAPGYGPSFKPLLLPFVWKTELNDIHHFYSY